MNKALQDVKVLDFTRALAGPYCAMILRELGAEVIKAEIPTGGDMQRTNPPLTKCGESYQFISRNRGKKSITLNIASEKGRQIALDLAKVVDVVLENFSPGVMDRLGLGYEDLARINPRLIFASISGFGQTGPRSCERAYDVVAQAMGGLMSVTGFPDGPPTKSGPPIGDYLSAYHAAIGILAALHYRSISGKGQMVDISMQDGIWAITAPHYGRYFLKNEIPPRAGNDDMDLVPFGTYPAKDGYVVICLTTVGQWEAFLKVIGREDLVNDERYVTQLARLQRRKEVEAMVEKWSRTMTVEGALKALKGANVPCSPVPSFDQVASDPQLLSREMIIEVDQLISGKVKVTGSVFKMSETPGNNNFPAPFLGEHNFEVYSALGYSEAEIRTLADEGVI